MRQVSREVGWSALFFSTDAQLQRADCSRAQDSSSDIRPAPYQAAWQDLEFGVILHFSTNTFLDREWGDGTASPSVFNPTQFDPGSAG